MGICETCKHLKFDELWGEHKCLKQHRRIYVAIEECEKYE